MITELVSTADVAAARAFIERNDLTFESPFDVLIGVHDDGRLIAVGARAGNVLKMIAVAASHQGGAVLGELVTGLVANAYAAGFDALFVFTKPAYLASFAALNFSLLANQGRVALLEYGHGLSHWLNRQRDLLRPGSKGAVVMNCNPFTLGHRYLVDCATAQVDHLYVFIVREERSAFPFAVRLQLAQEALADLANVTILDTGNYLVSSATFPTYFLKQDDPVARIQMELDATLFGGKIAPFFGITRRFVGSEPFCPLTSAYNAALRAALPAHGVELIEIERKQTASAVISASRVRELMARTPSAHLSAQLSEYVPASTLAFLVSEASAPIRHQLENDMRTQ